MDRKTEKTFQTVQAHILCPGRLEASLTVECALVLPVFFVAVIILTSFMNAVKLQTVTNLELSNKARKYAVAAYYGEASAVPWITLSKSETYTSLVTFPGVKSVKVRCYAKVHVWDGSPLTADSGDDEFGNMVYLTDTASVYHTHSDCTHIDLSIFQSSVTEIGSLRNVSGGKYKPCQGFPKNYHGPVYATKTGDYYYPSLEYASLTRHVRMVSRKEAGELHECSRCLKRDTEELLSDAA